MSILVIFLLCFLASTTSTLEGSGQCEDNSPISSCSNFSSIDESFRDAICCILNLYSNETNCTNSPNCTGSNVNESMCSCLDGINTSLPLDDNASIHVSQTIMETNTCNTITTTITTATTANSCSSNNNAVQSTDISSILTAPSTIVSYSVSGILLVVVISCTILNLILLCRIVTLKKQYQQQPHSTNAANNYEMTSTEYTMVQQQNNPSTDNNDTLQETDNLTTNVAYAIPIPDRDNDTTIETGGIEEELVNNTKGDVAQANDNLYATLNESVPPTTLQDDPTPPTYAMINEQAPPSLSDRISDNTQTIPTYAVVNKQAPPIPKPMYDLDLNLEHQ